MTQTATIPIQEYDKLREASKEVEKRIELLSLQHQKELEEIKSDKTVVVRFRYEFVNGSLRKNIESAWFNQQRFPRSEMLTFDLVKWTRFVEDENRQSSHLKKELTESIERFNAKKEELTNGSWANVKKAIKLFFTT